jgi:hypothetical protein
MKVKDTETKLSKCMKLIDQGRVVKTKAGYLFAGGGGQLIPMPAKVRKLFRLARRELRYLEGHLSGQ